MPLFLLQMKCELDNVKELVPSLGDKWQITLIVGCLNDEETTKEIHLDLSNDKVELEGGGLADSSFSFSKQQKATITYVKRGNGSYTTTLHFRFRRIAWCNWRARSMTIPDDYFLPNALFHLQLSVTRLHPSALSR
jgi:hypothetical protein